MSHETFQKVQEVAWTSTRFMQPWRSNFSRFGIPV